jgi:hypothetical protein
MKVIYMMQKTHFRCGKWKFQVQGDNKHHKIYGSKENGEIDFEEEQDMTKQRNLSRE